MADARPFGTQELISVRYLTDSDGDIETQTGELARRVPPPRSGPEQIVRWLTLLVIGMLALAAGGIFWLHRASLASAANDLKGRHSAVDVMLWASGSKQTFNGALSDTIKRAQRDSAYQLDQMKPIKTEFDGVDLHNLSPTWNQDR
jgi:hypothetical protein